MLPWLAGIVPFGLVIGVSAARADIPALAGWLTGLTIYGGSAQVATIDLLNVGAAPGGHPGHGADHQPAPGCSTRRRWPPAGEARAGGGEPRRHTCSSTRRFVVGMDRYQRHGDRRAAHRYYLGGAVTRWVAWLLALGAGAVFGARLPAALRLEFVVPLYLVGEVVRRLADRATRLAALSAAVAAVVTISAPLHLNVVLGIVAGLVAGAAVAARSG